MPDQIAAASVVCGAPPLNDPAMNDGLLPLYRVLLWSQRRFPRLVRLGSRAGRPLMRHLLPDACWRLAIRRLPARDRATLADARTFPIIFGGMRRSWAACPDGVHDDAVLYTRPWNFDPAQIRAPIGFWHGSMDIHFHPNLARKLADSIPGAQLHIVPGEGHYSLPVKRAEEILAALARSSA
jgi:pimeloyl-ACP methyl ester carboxylesterase